MAGILVVGLLLLQQYGGLSGGVLWVVDVSHWRPYEDGKTFIV